MAAGTAMATAKNITAGMKYTFFINIWLSLVLYFKLDNNRVNVLLLYVVNNNFSKRKLGKVMKMQVKIHGINIIIC